MNDLPKKKRGIIRSFELRVDDKKMRISIRQRNQQQQLQPRNVRSIA